jgi:hypothetical protein
MRQRLRPLLSAEREGIKAKNNGAEGRRKAGAVFVACH